MSETTRETPRTAEDLLGLTGLITAEEREWQLKARTFATERILPTIDGDFEAKEFRKNLVPELGELGVLGMSLDGYGCAGAGPVSYGLVCHELEAADSSWRTFVSVQGSLAMTAIHRFGSEEQKQQWLPGMAKGELIGCFALTEPHGGSDPASMKTTAKRDGDDWIIKGQKRWIGLASIADVAIVWARTDEGVRGFVVPTTTVGFRPLDIVNKMSLRASIQCDLYFDDLRVPADALLPEAVGLAAAFSCLDEARYGIIWGALGAARVCLDAAVTRATTRETFGAPVASHQLVQHSLAEAFVEYEKGMLLALHLGRLKEKGPVPPEQISIGKLNSVREAIAIAHAARGILGGDGVTTEFPVMRHLANLESVRTYEGTDEIHTLVVGRALTGVDAFR
ncbi:MAG TPA: acyl-CoA dehydrogenase family protein [Terrimesophilobacter sp.]|nr:acyl-CoA dehydrogenase family protein [Terrimesophilobacter sp.]HRP99403.1 acyl-CoA dehydrogenase family protein [Terrimesophilobacter sp.]